ncbi:hypothetical protein BDQ17DRAFT_1376233 [Cyathus striatus]|nr:hypothetical protein BDQ17DRAFT_1376233 [Cyathus striatus]
MPLRRPPTAIPAQSNTFNAADADVIFRSSDGARFSIHKKNLEITTGGFPTAEFETDGAPIPLTETFETLELLFQFVYAKRHPSLANTKFEVLAPLAEAAEKYEVFPAMNICHIRMIKFLDNKQNVEHIMAYAAKHNYNEVVDAAAPLVISNSIGDVVRLLPPHLILPWVCYRQQWQDVLTSAYSRLASCNVHNCRNCNGVMSGTLMSKLDLSSLSDLRPLIEAGKGQCSQCPNRLESWKTDIENQLKGIQSFSGFF